MKKTATLLCTMLFIGSALLVAEENSTMTLQTIEGKIIHVTGTNNGFSIPEYKNKIVFVEFWGTRCPPCLMSIPHYVALQKKYKDDLAILAIEAQGMPEKPLKAFAQRRGMNYDIVGYRSGAELLGYVGLRTQWGGGIPFLLVLDKSGSVTMMQPGMIPQNELEKIIDKLISSSKDKN